MSTTLSSAVATRDGGFRREAAAHAWRYLRLTRPLIPPLAVGPILLVLIAVLIEIGMENGSSDFRGASVAFLCAAAAGLFALAFGAASFAGECESGTDALLRRLPIRPAPLIAGVFAAGALGAALTGGISLALLVCVDLAFGHASLFSLPWSYEDQTAAVYWLGLGAAFLAWGVFFSLKIRRVIWAAIAAAATAYVSDTALTSRLAEGNRFTWEGAAELSHFRLALTALVVWVDASLIRAWLRPEPAEGSRKFFAIPGRAAQAFAKVCPSLVAVMRRTLLPGAQPDLHRPAAEQLLWLQARQAGALVPVLRVSAAVMAMLVAAGLGVAAYSPIPAQVAETWRQVPLPSGIAVILGMQALTGVFVFGQDRWRGTRRFPAARPIAPGTLWLARQRWGLAWCAIWSVLLAGWLLLAIVVDANTIGDRELAELWGTLPWGLAVYAAGQLAGMGAPGIIHAVILTAALTFFGGLLPTLLFAVGPDEVIPGMSFTITLAVFVAAMFWQSRRSIRGWLEERPPAFTRDRLLSPVLWGPAVIWLILPWGRVLLVPGAESDSLRSLRTAQRTALERWIEPRPSGLQGFAATVKMARIVYRSAPLSRLALSRETASGDSADDPRKQFLESPSAAEFFKLAAEIPKQAYADPQLAARLRGNAQAWSPDDYDRDPFWIYFHGIRALENFARASVRAGEIEETRSLLLAALCLRFRLERTYPGALGPFYHSRFTGGWQSWGDVVWEWSRMEGQTPDSLRALLREIQDTAARQRLPLSTQTLLIGEYWRDAFVRDAGMGRGHEGPMVAWWPDGVWFLPIAVAWFPGEWQLHRARMDRILAEYLPVAMVYDERGLIPWEVHRRLASSGRQWTGFRPIGWNAAAAIRQSLDEVFRGRLFGDLQLHAACLRLALRAYALDFGRYPDRLEELVPQYMPRSPRIPGSGEDFVLQYPGPGLAASEASAVPVLQAGGTEFPLEPQPTEGGKPLSGRRSP